MRTRRSPRNQERLWRELGHVAKPKIVKCPKLMSRADARRLMLKTCEWSEDEDGVWNGTCGMAWELTNGTPKDNQMLYCPRCGGKLHEEAARPKGEQG